MTYRTPARPIIFAAAQVLACAVGIGAVVLGAHARAERPAVLHPEISRLDRLCAGGTRVYIAVERLERLEWVPQDAPVTVTVQRRSATSWENVATTTANPSTGIALDVPAGFAFRVVVQVPDRVSGDGKGVSVASTQRNTGDGPCQA